MKSNVFYNSFYIFLKMQNPVNLIQKAIQRTQYNAGRVLKEGGLCK
jgi:hypothetical protein